MESVLNVVVSRFSNYKSVEPSQTNLLEWLQDSGYRKQVEKIRSISDKAERDRIKATLPGVTVSGLFQTRNKQGLIKHSGLICIDIDQKDNTGIENFYEMKQLLCTAPFVAYCALSVSGRGFFAIIPILHTGRHEAHFMALQKIFSNNGITIDKACKDISRLRGYSWDEAPYINHHADRYGEYITDLPTVAKMRSNFKTSGDGNKSIVERYINEITAKGIDIAPDYETWRNIGFALATEFGEAGREYFHLISQYHSGYSRIETNRQYTCCLRSKKGGIRIGTFFHVCKQHCVKNDSS